MKIFVFTRQKNETIAFGKDTGINKIMGYVLYKQQQSKNAGNQHNKRIMSSACKKLLIRFPHKQVISAWRALPDKDRLMVFFVDMRQLGIERTAEIMNRPVAKVIKDVGLARALVKKKLFSNFQEACLSENEQ